MKKFLPGLRYSLILAFFCALGAVFSYFLSERNYQNEEVYISNIEQKLAKELERLKQEENQVLLHFKADSVFFGKVNPYTTYPVYLYQEHDVVYWSDFRFVPPHIELEGDYELKLLSLEYGQFLVSRTVVDANKRLEMYALLPIFLSSKIDNEFLNSGFNTLIFENNNLILRATEWEEGTGISQAGFKNLFYVDFLDGYRLQTQPILFGSFALFLLAVFFFLIAAYRVVHGYSEEGKHTIAFSVLLLLLGSLRLSMYLFDFPNSQFEFDLFSSRFFASSAINPSLGDLFVNVSIGLILVIYVFRHYADWKPIINVRGGLEASIISVLLIMASFLVFYLNYSIFEGLYLHSQWNLDITQEIEFGWLKSFSLFVVFIAGIGYFLFCHVVYQVVIRVNKQQHVYIINHFLLASLLFLTLANLANWPFLTLTFIHGAYFIIIYFFDLPRYLAEVRYITFLYFFVGALVCAANGTAALSSFERFKDENEKQKFANQLLVENDILGEYLLNEALEKISKDQFIQNRMLTPFSSKEIVEQKIRRYFLSSYFDRYDIEILLFNSAGESLQKDKKSERYATLRRQYNREAFATEYKNIFFISEPGKGNLKQYVAFSEIKRRNYAIAFVVIDLRLKRVAPNSVYPQLLVDKRFLRPMSNPSFDYAIYFDEELMYSSGQLKYENLFSKEDFKNKALFNRGIKKDGYHHLGVRGLRDRDIIVSSMVYPFRNLFTNFSFLFLIHLFGIILIILLLGIYFSFSKVNLNYAAKIQLYLNLSFFIPLLVLSITTLSVISSGYRQQMENDYFKKAENLSFNIFNTDFAVSDKNLDPDNLLQQLAVVSRYAEADLHVYDTKGKLIASSQPQIFDQHILSEYINPNAFASIVEREENQAMYEEYVGNLNYKSIYMAIRSNQTGALRGVLSIPFFDSKFELERQITLVLGNIISVFTIIFILFLLISYVGARVLTFPLRLITQKIKRTTLSSYNEPLEWNSEDEIGLMVGEYNRMLLKLEESKLALSKTEKESAWREMAKQVAHEIKNPLTPMKLTIQHLQRLSLDKQEMKQMLERPLGNLLGQIDTLSDIATSFSSFAQMPIPQMERMDIAACLKTAVNLHHQQHVEIEAEIPDRECLVLADHKLMGRIFTNLILNAIQAVPADRKAQIKVTCKPTNGDYLISIKDNGQGIPEGIREKVFVPNFSTKFSGSGIGLAISKRGVEQAGGKIWFETKEGKGTVFFILLPSLKAS